MNVEMTDYQKRREWLLSQIEPDSAVILVGNTEKVRNKNINFLFRQDNDFYYLTGFKEPNAVAVLRPNSDKPFVMFNNPSDEYQEVWFAARAGLAGAKKHFGADEAFDIADLDKELPALLGHRKHIYISDELGRFEDKLFSWINQQRRSVKFDEPKVFRSLHSILPFVHDRRRVKEPSEIAKLRKAVEASTDGHIRLMKVCQPGINEQQLAGEFFNEVSRHGCQDFGYPSIIAGGNNACCLHYSENNSTLNDGELILVDAGGDYQYYTADITRTYPINGKFTPEQKAIYELVLKALDTAISKVKPGANWNSMYPAAMEVLAQGLIDLKILNSSFEEVMENKLYEQYTLHKTGHFLGLDVHDVGRYQDDNGDWISFKENMIFTIEPGLYFPKHCDSVDERWRGIGVRIEDDILVTTTGCENLSAGVPRTVEEIEKLMNA